MNRHLSDEQISLWLAGDRSPGDRQHLVECATCAGELAKTEATLSQFRSSVRAWSEIEAHPPAQTVVVNRPMRRVLAIAALIGLVAVPVYRESQAREKARNAALDARLLEQVDAGISRAVPETMEPLVKLVSWGPAPESISHKGKTE